MKLSIIIPAYNEEERIAPMLEAYTGYFCPKYGDEVELIVVINGTTDGTEGVVRKFMESHPQVRCLVEPEPVGKGGAVMMGFKEAKGRLLGFTDADGATPPEAYDDLVDKIGDAEAIIASRWRKDSDVSPRQPLDRRIASRCFNFLTRMVFGLRLTDTQCGAKLFEREALLSIMDHLGITRWAFDVDLLFQLRRAGFEIKEIATTWHDVAGSKINVARDSLQMLVALVRLRLLYSPFKWVVTLYGKWVSPVINPDGLGTDYLLRHSMLLMVATQFGNLFNILFQVMMVRMLSEAQFGIVTTMLGITLVLNAPLFALGRAVAHHSADFFQANRPDKLNAMLAALCRDFAIVAAVLVVLTLCLLKPLTAFFHLPTSGPIFLTGLIMIATLFLPLFQGPLHGRQAFYWVAASGIGGSFVRFTLAVALVAAGFFAQGALTAHTISLAVMVGICGLGLSKVMTLERAKPARPAGFYAHLFRYMIAFTAYSILVWADVILIKHFFLPDEAGFYSQAAVVGRIIIFLPQPIALAMFPKVISKGKSTDASRHTLKKALILVFMIAAGIALVCTVLTGPILQLLSGERSPELEKLLRIMVFGLTPLSIIFVILNYELAQRRYVVVWPLVLCSLGYLGSIILWHETFVQILVALIVSSSLSLALVAIDMLRRENRTQKAEGASGG